MRRPVPSSQQADHYEDRLTVRTPEHVALDIVLAGAGNRFLALAVDLLLQGLAILGLFTLLGLLAWAAGSSLGRAVAPIGRSTDARLWLTAGLILALFLLNWGYFTLFETIWAGQTPGKRLLKIRVLREDGRPVGFTEAAIRNLIRTVLDCQPFPTYAIGFLTGILNARFKRLGDFAAGTVVIRERRQGGLRSRPRPRPSVQEAATAPGVQIRPLTNEEAATLQAYLRRRDELGAATRAQVAQRIALSLKQRLGIRQPTGMSFDAFLEWLDHETRKGPGLRA
jgi:uncharacterized RDD family membrane protein YckC